MVGKETVMICAGVQYYRIICWEGIRKSWWTFQAGHLVNQRLDQGLPNYKIGEVITDCVVLNCMNENRMKWVW